MIICNHEILYDFWRYFRLFFEAIVKKFYKITKKSNEIWEKTRSGLEKIVHKLWKRSKTFSNILTKCMKIFGKNSKK